MSDQAASAFVRQELIPERAAPIKTTGFVGFLRTRLFNSPTNILITIVSALLLWFTVVPAVKFLLIDAVWQGRDRNACLAENAGHVVGACWPFVQAKFTQFVYGFYPEPERWRVNLTFILAALLLLPLLIPRLPAKGLNAGLFFIAFPVVAFFLLHGGGLHGFGVSWTADFLAGFTTSIGDAGAKLIGAGDASTVALVGVLLALLGKTIVLLSSGISLLLWPLVWLRDQIQGLKPAGMGRSRGHGGHRLDPAVCSEWRLSHRLARAHRQPGDVRRHRSGDRADAPRSRRIVDCRYEALGGLLVTLVVSVTGIVTSMPVGIALALGRRSTIPLIRAFSVAFIEFWRGVPLITVLFFATYMLPLFLPGNFSVDGLVRVLVGVALFTGAYVAEVIRGGLQAIPRGQGEAASALGLSYWKTTGLIVMPQALRHVIPGLVNSFIALFKDTSLVSIVALFDLLGSLRASFADPVWATPTTLFTGFAFTGMVYFVFCFGMSRYSLFVERRLNAHRRN